MNLYTFDIIHRSHLQEDVRASFAWPDRSSAIVDAGFRPDDVTLRLRHSGIAESVRFYVDPFRDKLCVVGHEELNETVAGFLRSLGFRANTAYSSLEAPWTEERQSAILSTIGADSIVTRTLLPDEEITPQLVWDVLRKADKLARQPGAVEHPDTEMYREWVHYVSIVRWLRSVYGERTRVFAELRVGKKIALLDGREGVITRSNEMSVRVQTNGGDEETVPYSKVAV